MERSIDWLTLTLKKEYCDRASSREAYGKALGTLRVGLHLDELFEYAENKGRARFYSERLSINGINIKLSSPDIFWDQGFCIELSGQGLRYFEEYLLSYGYTLKMWLSKWRALCTRGYITDCTRYDYALDDKAFNDERPKLTINKVVTAIYNCEMVSKARVIGSEGSEPMSIKQRIKKTAGRALLGTTVSVGCRESGCYIRFYDKKIERMQAREQLPENLKSWVRCEFEFHGEQAMCMLNNYLDYDDKDYIKRFCEIANEKVRFIDRIASNVSRCPVKRWWKEFLNGCVKRRTFTIIKPVRLALGRAERGLRQHSRNIATLIYGYGMEGFTNIIFDMIEQMEAEGKSVINSELLSNIKDNKNIYENVSAFNKYGYTTELSDEQLRKNIEEQRYIFSQQDYKIFRAPEEYGNRQKHIVEGVQ